MRATSTAHEMQLLLSRRQFLELSAAAGAGAVLAGCATNPVTGKRQLMLLSEQDEIRLDRQKSPHQFSADYGPVQDEALNRYVSSVGQRLAAGTHRPHMPHSFRAVNAVHVNAYAFPGGSIAATRGILLNLDNEAELAALLGHELGHVSARHGARQMTKGALAVLVVAGAAAYLEREQEEYASLAAGLGGIGSGLLLAHYSRDNEREADALGTDYIVRAGHNPKGMVGLMEMLRAMPGKDPNAIKLMFATHPMSAERHRNAVAAVNGRHASASNVPLNRERYLDSTAELRGKKGAIEEMQKGNRAMGVKKPGEAHLHYRSALKQAPDDYAGLLMMADCCTALGRKGEARRYVQKAKAVYPKEAQARHASGMLNLAGGDFAAAHADFLSYKTLLPGNPNTLFYNGRALEGMGRKNDAAREYTQYLQSVNQGEAARYAYQRLVQWGYIKEE